MLATAAGLVACAREATEQAEGKPYHHTADGRFRSPPGSPERAGLADLIPFLFRRLTQDDAVNVPEGHALGRDEAVAALERLDGQPSITWIGHATFLMRIGGRTILTDPFLSERAGPAPLGPKRYVPPGIPIEALPPIDIVIVSHNHFDQLDLATIEALAGKAHIAVVVPLKLGHYFRARGYRRVHELDWHESVKIGAITVTAYPGVHFSRRGMFDFNKELWVSFGIKAPGTRVFFSGDTAYGPFFKGIGARDGPFDIALVGIGAYEPRVMMKGSHTTPEEAVMLGRDLQARVVVGMHWGTVKLSDEDPLEPPVRFRKAAAEAGLGEDRAWIMRIGETRALPKFSLP